MLAYMPFSHLHLCILISLFATYQEVWRYLSGESARSCLKSFVAGTFVNRCTGRAFCVGGFYGAIPLAPQAAVIHPYALPKFKSLNLYGFH